MSAQESPTKNPPRKRPRLSRSGADARTRKEMARTVALLVLAVLVTLFAVLNLKDVKVNWIFGSGNAPLIIVIVISVLVGIVLTYGAERINSKRRR
jgi:uncharacterized integral membrane protein